MAIPTLALLLLEPKTRKIAGVLLAVHLAVYCILSYHGEYVPDSSPDGSTWWAWGCAPDHNLLPFRERAPSAFGLLFWPLIFFDQGFVHQPPR